MYMKLSVKLFATLREGRGKQLDIEIDDGSSVSKVLEKLGIRKTDASIVLINGNSSGLETVLSDGDTLSLFPPVGGG